MYGYITLDMLNIGYQEFFRLERCTFALQAAFAEKKKKRKGAGTARWLPNKAEIKGWKDRWVSSTII